MAIIVCPECGKEISDQHEFCIYCGFPIKPKEDSKEKGNRVEAHDVMVLDYSSKKQEAKDSLIKICGADDKQANEVLAKLPCYIYEDIDGEFAEKIAKKLVGANFRVAIYNETGKVKFVSNNDFSSKPLPLLVPAPRKKRIITLEHVTFNPRPIIMPTVTLKYNETFKAQSTKIKKKVATKKIKRTKAK